MALRYLARPAMLGKQHYRAFSATNKTAADAMTAHEQLLALDHKPTSDKGGAIEVIKRTVKGASGKTKQELDMEQTRHYFRQQLSRVYRTGDVYSPHDLNGVEAAKFKKRLTTPLVLEPRRNRPQRLDSCDALKLNPVLNYKNVAMLSEFINETGMILHSRLTQLRPVNQRKMAKAIRRAVAVGLIPSVHKHPLLLDPRNVNIRK